MILFVLDSAPDKQPQETPEVRTEENKMDVNCNGHVSSEDKMSSSEEQGTKQSAEEHEDQQNANQPEGNTQTCDTLCNTEEHQTCNDSHEDPNTNLQQPRTSTSPDSVSLELNEGDKKEKEEGMDTQGETKRENEDVDSESG